MVEAWSRKEKNVTQSELERLCVRSFLQLAELGRHTGLYLIRGQSTSVSVSQAINMLMLTETEQAGFVPGRMTGWTRYMRSETLAILGSAIENWQVNGSSDEERAFWSSFYKGHHELRQFAARMLNCDLTQAARQLRFHSESEVEIITDAQFQLGFDRRSPLLVLDAQDLARRVRAVTSGPLFFASPKSSAA